jgi:hypothetical protein
MRVLTAGRLVDMTSVVAFPAEPTAALPALKIFEDIKNAKNTLKIRSSAAVKATLTIAPTEISLVREKQKEGAAPLASFAPSLVTTAGINEEHDLVLVAVRGESAADPVVKFCMSRLNACICACHNLSHLENQWGRRSLLKCNRMICSIRAL